mgnify:CR=1 FL=1
MQIRLILLDFDGTLADTRRANTLAYVATLREAGYALTEEEYAAKYFGMRCNEFLTRYGIADPGERERLRLRKIALYPAFFDTVRLNRPLWEFCRQFRAQGGRVWIVSTGSRANIDNAMRHLGITVAGQRAGSTGAATSGAAGRDLTGADEAWLPRAGRRAERLRGRHTLGRRRRAQQTRPGLLSGGHAPRGLHAAGNADLRRLRNRARSGPPQRSGLFQGNALTIAAQAVPGILYPASAPDIRHPASAAGRTHSSAPSPTASIRPIFHNRAM